jgi:thiosulfate dehydrogenase
MWKIIKADLGMYLIFAGVIVIFIYEFCRSSKNIGYNNFAKPVKVDSAWNAPSLFLDNELEGEDRKLVIYGQDLIANTSKYFGPNGSVKQITNGMNCQNCHLEAGTKNFGNNYGAVFSTYPKFRERSGQIESIYKRVSDCMERSLNGTTVDSNSYEYKAIYAYIKWLGKDVVKGKKPYGSGIDKISFLNRAASALNGKLVYVAKCQSCHGDKGGGVLKINEVSYEYPPLWGEHSYNNGAGLFRLSNFAGYIKSNMPFNIADHDNPLLTDEEAWDVAAFVNSQPRPFKDQTKDWPDISKKPVDFPFGPYTDGFTEQQHKFGPYKPIVEKRDNLKK